MWGVVGSNKKSKTDASKGFWEPTLDLVTPRWEQRHPTWVFVLNIIQTLLISLVLYFCIFPSVQYAQMAAIRTQLEMSLFNNNVINCSVDVCFYSKTLPKSNATRYSEIGLMSETYMWLSNVIAPLYQGGFISNFNQIYLAELKLEKSPLINETNSVYSTLLAQNLGSLPWNVSKSYAKTYFRTTDEDFNKDLTYLYNDGWFNSTTSSIQLLMKFFNGYLGNWVKLKYIFNQSTGGGILKSVETTTGYLALTNDPSLLFPLIFLWCFILFTLWEPIREVTIIRGMQHDMNIMAGSQIGAETKLTKKSYLIHYMRFRGLIGLTKVLKLIFVIFLLYRLLKYPISGPYDVLMASRQKDASVPDSTVLASDLTLFVVWGGICIGFTCVNIMIQLQKIHPDLGVVVNCIINFFGVFYGCFLIFIVLWFSWALSNHLSFGPSYEAFQDFFSSIFITFRFFFGERYQKYNPNDQMSASRSFQFIFMQVGCHIFVISICIAAVTHFYAFSETHRIVTCGNEPTATDSVLLSGRWVRRKCRKGCERRCFCFTPDPAVTFLGDDSNKDGTTEDKTQLLKRKLSAYKSVDSKILDDTNIDVFAVSFVSVNWKHILLVLYFLFLIPFIIGVIFLLNQNNQYQHFKRSREMITVESFVTYPRPPPIPYDSNDSFLPHQNKSILNSTVMYPHTITDIFVPDSIRNWILDVIITRYMNPLFYDTRHEIHIANPFVITFSCSSIFMNPIPFLAPIWPTSTSNEPSISDIIGALSFSNDNQFTDASQGFSYVRIGTYGGTPPQAYILRIYYGPTEIIYSETKEALERLDILGWKTREVIAEWVEYNGDGRMFIRNALVAKIPITGKVDATFTCDIFPESTNDQIYVDPTLPVIDYFVNGSFPILLTATILFFIYFAVHTWAIVKRKVQFAIVGTILDLFLLVVSTFLVFAMFQVPSPTFQPLWDALDIPSRSAPSPSGSVIPGPKDLYSRNAKGLSIFLPSSTRAFRILQQINSLLTYRNSVYGISAYGVLASLFRFPLFFIAFPYTIISSIPKIYKRVQWKVNMLIFVLVLIGLGMLALQYICLGSLIYGLSTPQLAVISGWLIATSKWNLQYTSHVLVIGYFVVQVALVILWIFLLNNLILAALLYGLRSSNAEKYQRLKIKLCHTLNLQPREKNVLKANQKVLIYWNSIAKALQIQKRNPDSDGDFGRQIDYFFLRFRTSSLFTKAPENVEEYLRRSIQAHNLTRVQQNIADILMIKCKSVLLQEDIDNVKELTSRVSKTTHAKTKYIRTLEKKLQVLQEKRNVLKDTIAFHQADFRPDITLLARDTPEPEGRHEDVEKHRIELQLLTKKRDHRLKRIEEKRKKQKEAFEAPKSEETKIFSDAPHYDRRIGDSRPTEQTTAYNYIDKEKGRRKGARQKPSSDEEEDWEEARRALLSAPSPQKPFTAQPQSSSKEKK